MKAGLNKVLVIAATLILAGCASQQSAPSPAAASFSVVQIAPNLTLHMPSFGGLDRPVDIVQNVVMTYGDRVVSFEGRINASSDHFTMVCIDPMGRRAISIKWTDGGISYEAAPWVPPQLRPQNILADFVVMYWPQSAVAKALPSALVTSGASGRSVFVDGKEILHAEYFPSVAGDIWSGKTTYKNSAWNYSLVIQSVSLTP